MDYFNSVTDDNGYVHSVDMVIIDYYLKCSYATASQKLLEKFSSLVAFDSEKNSSLGNLPNFKYQYYVDMIWFDGFVIYLGKYANYDRLSKSWTKLDMIRIKVNPNKHLNSSLFVDIIHPFLSEWCTDGFLVRWDYAIDVPVSPDSVSVIGSRKEKGLYRGTRYFGQRHKHGYLKIYDKQKEQNLESPMTRIEYTFQAGLPPSWDNIYVKASEVAEFGSISGLRSARLYLDMLIAIRALGGDIEPFIEKMDNRTFKKIEPFLYSGKQLQCDESIIDELLKMINDIFIIADIEQKSNNDYDDFMTVDSDLPLPFD